MFAIWNNASVLYELTPVERHDWVVDAVVLGAIACLVDYVNVVSYIEVLEVVVVGYVEYVKDY